MLKKIIFASMALALAGCVAGGGGYPATQTASTTGTMDSAAMIGNVIGAMSGAQTQQTVPAQTTANSGDLISGVIGAMSGAQTQQTPVQQNSGQAGLAGILGAVGGQNNLNGVVQSLLVNQCSVYINSQQMWQTARVALGNQAQHWENQICQCASQEAMNNMTAEQLTQLGMSAVGGQAAMTQATAGLLSQTAMNCMQRIAGQGMLLR